jgi:uncharacterized protein YeaO (DUF488 family)
MLGLEDDSDALWLELTLKPVGDLRGQPFLDLQVTAEELDDPAEFAEADDPLAREVRHVRDPVKREQVVHAQRVKRDRPSDDELVVAVVVGKGGGAKCLRREQLGVGVGDPARCLLESLTIDVGAEGLEQIPGCTLDGGVVDTPAVAGALGRLSQRQRGNTAIVTGHVTVGVRRARVLTVRIRHADHREQSEGRMDIRVKRAYEPAARTDGHRVLIDRLWPRGVSRRRAKLDGWEKGLAPSPELRQWFGHDPRRFEEFRRRYFEELSGKRPQLTALRRRAREGTLTLVYSARDTEHNDAVVLAEALRRGLPKGQG